jgi:L-lactate dehydrogenase
MSKIVIIGAGHVGSHCAQSLLLRGLCSRIVLLDTDQDKARCHALDLADAASATGSGTEIREGDYADCRDADIVVISAGAPRRPGQTRTDVMRDTVAVAGDIIPRLADTGFRGTLICISNPADVIAHLFWSKLGLPKNRVFSTGTGLDTARLRRIVARRERVSPASVSGYVLGEHGDAQMAAWSQVSVGGRPLRAEEAELAAMEEEARRTGTVVIDGKGATEFGIGAVLAETAAAVLRDEGRVMPVSTLLEGEYGQRGVFAGVPAVIGAKGVEGILSLQLTPEEERRFAASCGAIRRNIAAAHELYGV